MACILADAAAGALRGAGTQAGALPALRQLLLARGRPEDSLVSGEGYKRGIDAAERAAGAAAGKPREKLTDVAAMLQAAKSPA